jgi:hypothetical protein
VGLRWIDERVGVLLQTEKASPNLSPTYIFPSYKLSVSRSPLHSHNCHMSRGKRELLKKIFYS